MVRNCTESGKKSQGTARREPDGSGQGQGQGQVLDKTDYELSNPMLDHVLRSRHLGAAQAYSSVVLAPDSCIAELISFN